MTGYRHSVMSYVWMGRYEGFGHCLTEAAAVRWGLDWVRRPSPDKGDRKPAAGRADVSMGNVTFACRSSTFCVDLYCGRTGVWGCDVAVIGG